MVLARRAGESLFPYLLRALRHPFELTIAPLAAPLSWLQAQIVFGPREPVQRVRRAQASPNPKVEILVNAGEQNGLRWAGRTAAEMIRNVLDFGDLRAGDVMVPSHPG